MSGGTKLGCFGRCKVCGKAIRLYETAGISDPPGTPCRDQRLVWVHYTHADHPAVLNPGVCDACAWCGKVAGHENGCRLGLGPDEIAERQPCCPCGLKTRPGSCGWCEE